MHATEGTGQIPNAVEWLDFGTLQWFGGFSNRQNPTSRVQHDDLLGVLLELLVDHRFITTDVVERAGDVYWSAAAATTCNYVTFVYFGEN